MKPIFLIVIAYVTIASGKLQCDIRPLRLPTDWLDMEGGCVGAVKRQIQDEIDASIKYMAMGVHFSQDVPSCRSDKVNALEVKYWKGTIALEDALKTEAVITKKIKYVIQKCEEDDRSNDYHMVDY
ncbi:hypothetical protein HA402_001901 [Bradysia odoriphaga]|nr:hypothetical protein HA402_001901 [Bradysia odoriphaga]